MKSKLLFQAEPCLGIGVLMKCVAIILLSVSFFLSSCHRVNDGHDIDRSDIATIDIDPKQNPADFGDFIKKVTYVQLETNNNCLIGEVSKVILTDSSIIICDRVYSKAIYIFDYNGRFKYSIKNQGKGPGEYLGIQDVALSPEGSLWIFDMTGRRLVQFSKNGKYISTCPMPFFFRSFEFISEDKLAFFTAYSFNPGLKKNEREYVLIRSDLSGKTIRPALLRNYDDNKFNTVTQKPLRLFGDKVFLNPIYSDTIYTIGADKITAKYVIHIDPSNHIPPITKETTTSDFEIKSKDKYCFLGDFIDLKDYVVVFIAVPTGYPFVIYSKAEKKTYPEKGNFKSLIEFIFCEPVARYKDNTAVTAVSPFQIKNLEEQILISEKDTLLQSLVKKINVNDNPVLFFYEFKEPN